MNHLPIFFSLKPFFFFFFFSGSGSSIYIYVQKVHINKEICNLQSQGSYKETKCACRVDHLQGSTGEDSSRTAAASKHSAASSSVAPTSALQSSPRLYQAEGFVLSSRSASVRRLLTIGSDWPPRSRSTQAVDIKLGTWLGSTSNAFLNAFRASWWRPLASQSKPNKSPSLEFLRSGQTKFHDHATSTKFLNYWEVFVK